VGLRLFGAFSCVPVWSDCADLPVSLRTYVLPALLLISASLLGAQSIPPTGALSGRLTDLHSRPIGGATLRIRNSVTGDEVTGTSGKNGAYRFTGLVPGEYSLEANSSSLGEGHIGGIYVAAGHEARVQAAVEFQLAGSAAPVTASLAIPHSPTSATAPAETRSASSFPPRLPTQNPPIAPVTVEARFLPEAVGLLPLTAIAPPGSASVQAARPGPTANPA